MARTSKSVGSKKEEGTGDEFRYFILAFRSGMDAIENTLVTAAEIPLSILSGLGVSAETTQAARTGNRQLAHSIHGTMDTIATQIADVVSKQASIASDAVSQAAKKTAKKTAGKTTAKRTTTTKRSTGKTTAKRTTTTKRSTAKTTAKRPAKTTAKRPAKTTAKRTQKS